MPACEPTAPMRLSRLSRLPLIAVALSLFAGNARMIRADGLNAVEPHTEAAVIADDNGWSKAEESGDTAFIDALLLPEYRSISSDGSTHDKAAILASARKNIGSTQRTAMVEKWNAAHPHVMEVKITGDTAILTFSLDKPTTPKPILSCDVFVYREGRWHALYSQHTEAEK